MMFVFLLLGLPNRITLPDLERVTNIILTDHSIYVLDARAKKAYFLDEKGAVRKLFEKVGFGPGEWQEPILMRRASDGKIYVCDLRKSAIFVFTSEMEFIEQVPVHGLCRDIAVIEDDWYVVAYDPVRQTMIQLLEGKRHEHTKSFGRGLESKNSMFGLQVGIIATDGECLYFVGKFNATINVFTRDGDLVDSLHPTGVAASFLPHKRTLESNFWNDIRYTVSSLKLHGSSLSLVIYDRKEGKSWAYGYNLATKTWCKPKLHKAKYETPQGDIFELEEDDETYQLVRVNKSRSNL